ncbi:MAG TPA: hypothetical protein VFC73_07765 [Syntrophomonadaceae bacterium]|nr:hypothetical protein [Syntrophomonadaceae bacterium]
MEEPNSEEKEIYTTEVIDDIQVHISGYFTSYEGADKIVALRRSIWDEKLYLRTSESHNMN